VEPLRKRDLLVSKTWIQAVALVMVFGFFIMGLLAYRTYTGEAPIPARVVDQKGNILFTHDDILNGQQVFLRNGLMEYGSIFGHGAYLGPDYTADYLRRSATSVFEVHGGQKSDSANSRTVEEFKTNRYDAASDTLTFTGAQATAFVQLKDYYHSVFSDPSTRSGLRPGAISDGRQTPTILRISAVLCGSVRSPRNMSGSSTFSETVNVGSNENCWNTKPSTPRLTSTNSSSESPATDLPATMSVPSVGVGAGEQVDERRLSRLWRQASGAPSCARDNPIGLRLFGAAGCNGPFMTTLRNRDTVPFLTAV
jgi:hypothetical protein